MNKVKYILSTFLFTTFIFYVSTAPVDVSKIQCDGDTYKCTANLNFGDGRWVAQWSVNVFHQ